MAMHTVFPRSELTVGGRFLRALELSATFGYRSPVATCTARVEPQVLGLRGNEDVRLRLGYRTILIPRFAGRIKGNSLKWSPKGVSFRATGPLTKAMKATGIEDLALAPTDPTLPPTDERWAYGAINKTDGQIITELLALVGLTDVNIHDTGQLFATLAPAVTSKYAVRLASGRAPYDLVKEIDEITGCRTFDGPDGRVTRIAASGLPSGSAARTFTQGADFNGNTASRELSNDEVSNAITVIGQAITDPDTGLQIPIKVTISAPSPYVDDPPGTNEHTFQSDLIESYDLALAVAQRLLGEKNRRLEYVTLPLVKGDQGIWAGMTVAVVSAALEMDGSERCRVVEVQETAGGRGYQTTLVLELAAGNQGSDPNAGPVAALDYTIELETTAAGDPIAVVLFDSSGSYGRDAALTSRTWDGIPTAPTPSGDGTTAVAVYDPLTDSPPPIASVTVTDANGKIAVAEREIVVAPGNAYTRELWIAEGDKLAYTEAQVSYDEYAVNAVVIPEEAGDEYQLAATAAGAASRVLATGAITALGTLADITAFFASRDPSGVETGIAWAAADDGRVWRSVDFGVTWTEVAPLPNGGACHAIQESPYASGDVYAGGGHILYHSYDAGASWQAFYTHADDTLTIARLASGITAADVPLMWLGGTGGLLVERGGTLSKTFPGGETPDITGLTMSLDAARIIVATGDDRLWVAPSDTSGELTLIDTFPELGDVRHLVRDGRFPIIWIASSTGTWKLVGEVGSPLAVRDEEAFQVAYGRLVPADYVVATVVNSEAPLERVLRLWNGASNDDPPHDWQIIGFDDSAAPWANSVEKIQFGAVDAVSYHLTPESNTEEMLVRRSFTMPPGRIKAATLYTTGTESIPDIYFNGVRVGGHDSTSSETAGEANDVTALINAGGPNVIAIRAAKTPTGSTPLFPVTTQFRLHVNDEEA
jgi:hypothetical protein